MNCVRSLWAFGAVVLFVGCQPVTYEVKITNNSPFPTDFSLQSDDDSPTTFVEDLAANGGTRTVFHTGMGLGSADTVTISSGTRIGNVLTPIDAQTIAEVTAHDLITVVKAPEGALSHTVTPRSQAGIRQIQQEVQRQVGKVFGR